MGVHSNYLLPHCNGTASADQPLSVEYVGTNSDKHCHRTTIKSQGTQIPSTNHNSLKSRMKDSKLKKSSMKRTSEDAANQTSSCSSSATASVVPHPSQRGLRLAAKHRSPRFVVRSRASDADMIAFPLGMSIAAAMAQVLDRKDAVGENVSVDHVSKICTSAVKESLANVFGDKFDSFSNNFEKSFESTFNTLRLIRDFPMKKQDEHLRHSTREHFSVDPASSISFIGGEPSSRSYDACNGHTQTSTISSLEQPSSMDEIQDNCLAISQKLALSRTDEMSRQLTIRASSGSGPIISTLEKSVEEQARANDLKTLEIGLTMKKLRLKESQLSLKSDSNLLERCKLYMGVSKASFKAEQFKSKLEDTRHAELLRKCIDCLVAGLIIMIACLGYGTYVYSFKRITDATDSCNTPTEPQSRWTSWIPNPVTTVSSGFQTFRCLVQVFSRMIFSILMILVIAYLLIQRPATARQQMPVTFILLLLGIACGLVGKFCIDTLGGSGYHWLMYWETLCAVHFFANIFTAALFSVLHGPVRVTESIKARVMFPFWIRRVFFYLTILIGLPVMCGLLPFASPAEWKDHFKSLFKNLMLVIEDDL